MKDNSGIIVTAILAHGQAQINEQNRQRDNLNNKLKQNELNEQNEGLSHTNSNLNNLNEELLDDIAIHQRRTREAWELFRKEREISNSHVDRINALQKENAYYKTLLSKPMLEIAEANGDFKKTYEMQMAFVADWMVSQKAFKELAIEFGAEKGLEPQQVIEMGLDKKIDVLEEKHDESHNTNIGDSTLISKRKDKLISKYHEDKAKRKSNK